MLRVDKYLSNATDLSRTEVKRLIKDGLVTVDDDPVSNPAQKVSGSEDICIDGSSISMPSHRYFMMNKPAGVVSATKDHNNSTALDLVYEHRSELQIAGRLDIDTTGLLLITDDGQWNHRLTSPAAIARRSTGLSWRRRSVPITRRSWQKDLAGGETPLPPCHPGSN